MEKGGLIVSYHSMHDRTLAKMSTLPLAKQYFAIAQVNGFEMLASVGISVLHGDVLLKWSLVFFKIRVPSSPGASFMSNFCTSLVVRVRSSISAKFLPMHPKGPIEKGAKASLCLTFSS